MPDPGYTFIEPGTHQGKKKRLPKLANAVRSTPEVLSGQSGLDLLSVFDLEQLNVKDQGGVRRDDAASPDGQGEGFTARD